MQAYFIARVIVSVWFVVPGITIAASPTSAPATRPIAAVDVYVAAAKLCTVDGPSNSAAYIGPYPSSYPPEWFALAEKAYHANTAARAMVRGVTPPPLGRWADTSAADIRPLNSARHIASDIGDASTYAFLQRRTGEAFDFLNDLATLSHLLRSQPADEGSLNRLLVGLGIDALRSERLVEFSPQLKVAAAGPEGIPRERVTALIADLLQQPLAEAEVEAIRRRRPDSELEKGRARAAAIEGIRRVNGEKTMAAMSLACQLYYADQGTWPEEATDLVPGYLPNLPIDPWGDGKQTFGYQLVPKGRPDGIDRPLVFCRCQSKDGLTFTAKRPLYDYYSGDGSNEPGMGRRELGQFRDVSFWEAK